MDVEQSLQCYLESNDNLQIIKKVIMGPSTIHDYHSNHNS
jgi:hypothetical protein